MLEELDSVADVLAIRVSHKITGADLDAIMDRLDALMASHNKVHVFVETHRIDGIDLRWRVRTWRPFAGRRRGCFRRRELRRGGHGIQSLKNALIVVQRMTDDGCMMYEV